MYIHKLVDKMELKLFINSKAKSLIRKIYKEIDSSQIMHIDRWLNETRTVKCYALFLDSNMVSFALLSKCDYDPFKTHSNPFILDFIYTFELHRRNGYMKHIILRIKETENVSAFCSNEISENLMKSNGFNYLGEYNSCELYRFP